MPQFDFGINKALQPEIVYLGHEGTPLIIIDDFATDIDVLKHTAQQSNFQPDVNAYYPGLKAPLPKDYVGATLSTLYPLIYDIYQVPTQLRLKPQNLFFALINQTEDTLKPLQCMPHFDTSSGYYFAFLHYLNSQPHGSTGFFRHIPTGYERISDNRREHYFNCAQQFIDDHGSPKQQYFVKSDAHFELYYQVPYKANRLIIYPGNLLHSTIVDTTTDIDSSAVSGRLTANLFTSFI
ncbi:DUF6445 family protein [Rheinheimera baltica]|uniref:DUF6445 family protein n=1 Tax=Rheinheimera baltica TaxID=67576 RepID=UPI0004193E9B|nr:DUF6445 family protein [Rheinheimera baltica]MDP5143711.1 DUF6445 family protein [Rheinheimera baltica]MDP5150924.1 DUF6445 family protein [Rheinheimera baltica]